MSFFIAYFCSMLQVKNIHFSYDKIPVLEDVSFTLSSGENLAVIGESGSGKSTLLKLLYGEYDLLQGEIFWKEQQILGPKYNLVIGYDFMKYVTQEFDLMPFITVEENIGNPLSPYAVTKYVNELYAGVYAHTYGFKAIGLRYFNVFGPKQSPNGAYAAVIPLFMEAVKNNQPATINGDGEQTRDFTFVENAVQANIKGFFAPKEAANQVFNIACGERISVNYLWEHINSAASKNVKAIYGPSRQGDVRDSLADISKAEKLMNYKPEFTVREGLKITWENFIK